ncbi:penicillin-binding transpeptidase domain-containing protein [Clostridium grantii]|uniref:Penicillin-binding protein 2 n=1 Tax=Clostridium grantii DSM 8605 TaxID=1121316 RepID=A0A1M5X3D7_9CLOT|nr:penicillin-binding transpeptidase domain-containing protein [Clostridium grantii]SHH94330.1 penicillin-binding protein 2 [Clostridium grantii DSM 8605]
MKKTKGKKNYRYFSFGIVVVIIFVVIISRLVFLQLVRGDEYREQAINRINREIQQDAPRGSILDRNGIVLAEDKQGYSITFTETEESKENIFETMELLFGVLNEHNIKIEDSLALKVNPLRFEFNSTNPDTIKARELRFKKDRGIDDFIVKSGLIEGKTNIKDLTDEEEKIVDKAVLEFSTEDTYQFMLELYGIEYVEKKEAYKNLYDELSTNYVTILNELLEKYQINNVDNEEKMNNLFRALYNNGKDTELIKLLDEYSIENVTLSDEVKREYLLVKDGLKMNSYSGSKSVTIASNIDKETALIINQMYADLPGIVVDVDMNRIYPYGEMASSAIGYLSKISPLKETEYEEKGYDANSDYIGAAGIEGALESTLKGEKGVVFAEINKQGRIVKEIAEKPAYPGNDVKLTIDMNLQTVAEKALEEALTVQQGAGTHGSDNVDTTNATRGAAVVIDVNTGKILAMVSKPGYDPNILSTAGMLTPELQQKYFNPDLEALGTEYVTNLLKRSSAAREVYNGNEVSEIVNKLFPVDESIEDNDSIRQDKFDIFPKYLFNYATQALTPPGSTFKPLMSIAALEENVVSPNETIRDGHYYLKYYADKTAKKNTSLHSGQSFNIYDALKVSNNWFFYEMGSRLYEKYKNDEDLNNGIDAIAKWAWQFGLGVPQGGSPYTGIEISEKFGQVYNYASNKKTMEAIYIKTLYDTNLIQGRSMESGDPTFIGVNLNVDSNDDEKIIEIKDEIKNYVAEKINDEGTLKELNGEKSSVKKNIEKLLTDLIKIDNEFKGFYDKEKATNDDFDKMVATQFDYISSAIFSSIYNARSEISNSNNLISASIGQGTNQFTPLQLAIYTAAIANGGTRYEVSLVDSIINPQGETIKEFQPKVLNKIDIGESTLNEVKEGMRRVDGEERGTAYSVFNNFPIETAGKTGSATFASYQEKIGRTAYGVYVGFAPLENPEIAISVVIFDGGHGGEIAGIAKAVYEEYFKETLKTQYPGYVPTYNYTNSTNGTAQNENTEANNNLEVNYDNGSTRIISED